MARPTRRPKRRQPPPKPVLEFLQSEVHALRDLLAALQRESAGHVRRCGEMQHEIDALKRLVAELSDASVSRLAAPPSRDRSVSKRPS
jgi:hypothetical protein